MGRCAPSLLCSLSGLVACEFSPIARDPVLERVIDQPLRVEHVLDEQGSRVVVSRREGSGRAFAIANWYAGKQCALPGDTAHVFAPLLPAEDARSGLRGVLLPLARGASEQELTLWLSDSECNLSGPFAGIDPSSARAFVSARDRRSVLGFLDREAALFVVDAHTGEPVPVASDVSEWRVSVLSADPVSDILWVRAAGHLTQHMLDGSLRVSLGDEVSEFALFDSLSPRVAYVDAGDLYEASAPTYVPTLRARDACAPVYSQTALDLFVPCAARQLVRVSIGPGEVSEFADGVYASRSIGPLRFEFQRGAEDESALYVEGPELARQRITPLFEPDSLRVLRGQRVAGRTAEGAFGIWTIADQTFETLFTHIERATPVADLSSDDEIILFHHDLDADGAGTLSTFRLSDLAPRTIASGVPRQEAGGYVLDAGQYFPNFPPNAPVIVYIEDAVRRDGGASLKGRLRVALLSGEFGTDLTDEVSSYAFATLPVSGLIVASEEGPRAGLWYAAL